MGDQDQFSNPFLQIVLEELVKEKGLINARIKIEPGSSKGDNYLGIIHRVIVNGERVSDEGKDSERDKLNMVFKCMPESKVRREQMETRTYFRNEVNFYKNVLQRFLTFQRERGVRDEDGFSCTAKCYRAIGEECYALNVEGAEEVVIMEDMLEKGYKMKDRRSGLDVAHCLLVVEQLAKLHALSMTMKDQKPEQFNNLKKTFSEILFKNPSKEGLEDYIASFQPHLEKAMLSRVPGPSIYMKRMCDFMKNYYQLMLECVDETQDEPYKVICHGDCWTNNILFKYSKNDSEPTSIILLDFQISRYASPVLDLSYFFFTCTEQSLRTEHYNHLLTRYYDTLAHFISQLGSNPQQLYPLTVFKEQLVKYSKFGFGMAIMVVPLFTSDAEDTPDLDVIYSEDYQSNTPPWNVLKDNNALYQERMSGIIVDLVDLGYI